MFKEKIRTEDGIWEVSPKEVWQQKKHVRLIDVRRPDEFTGELGHVEGAELVTLETEFVAALEKWNKNESIVFICRSGGRSAKATLYAQSKGFQDVYNMQGGMILWNEMGLAKE